MYVCKHFIIEELVPEEFYNTIMALPLHPNMAYKLMWSMFDERLLRSFDWIKEEYSPDNPVTINNWKWGGKRNWSCLRTEGSKWYSEGSMHSICEAGDMVFEHITAQQIRDDVIKRTDVPFTRMEGGVNWLHVDVKHTGLPKGTVYCFNP